MATIKVTDQLGLDEDVKLADFSALLQYVKQIPSLQLNNPDVAKLGGLTLDQPAIQSLSTGISFQDPVAIGTGAPDLFIQAGAHGSLGLIKAAPGAPNLPGLSGGPVAIPSDGCYTLLAINASVGVAVNPGSGQLTFGIAPGATMAIANYHPFPLHQGVTLMDAVRETIGGFVIPARTDDLAALPAGCLATVTGTGSLKLSVTAALMTFSNPLAAVSLPAPLPALSVNAGGSVQAGASLTLSCKYQICARKVDAGRVQLGWYRDQSSAISVTAKVSEGVTAGFGSTDLFSTIVGAISSDPAADLNELAQAKLSDAQIAAIRDAVRATVERKLELALSTEIFSSESADAAFLYDIDLGALTAESRQALEQALRGDLSAIHAGTLPGVMCVKSVWETAHQTGVKLNVNLLGILNFGSIASLTKRGKVLCEPVTGALVIADEISAGRIQSTQVNFGADSQKLRHVMAESFLITAAYHGTQRVIGGPSLHCSHSYFDLENQTGREQMLGMLRTGVALGLFSAEEADAPAEIQDFGRTMIHATTEYDDGLASGLFIDPNGEPMPVEFYETMGRRAIQFLVTDNGEDAVRLQPAIDDTLWAKMKDQGQPSFYLLFPNLPEPLLGAVTADYSTIVWWADAMAGAGKKLAAMRQWFESDDPAFEKLRSDLASHLTKVAANTSEEFGKPWGLLAMSEAASRRPGASILVTGPKLVRMKERPLAAVARPSQ